MARRANPFIVLLCVGALSAFAGCSEILTPLGLADGKPLNVTRVELRDAAADRSGIYYRLNAGDSRPATARPWLAAADFEALPDAEKLDTIAAEQRRGNVLLIDGGQVYFLPEFNLAKPGRPEPAFSKTERKQGY